MHKQHDDSVGLLWQLKCAEFFLVRSFLYLCTHLCGFLSQDVAIIDAR